ncbi:MAG: nitrous oxide reductase accessory protein NosL [Campylobacterota bacterium]|nr:nitrous oxide reductase accessory protein NosL [Campylobacterota bacterium]
MLKLLLSLALLSSLSLAQMFQSVPVQKAQLLQKGASKLYCPSCGMNLVKFYKTSHSLEKNGLTHQYCSLHCLVEANPNSDLIKAKVVDLSTLKFINAHDAFYVIGSSKPGTMTLNSKYAFATEKDASSFAKANGGKIVNFHDAVEIASNDLAKNNKMINKKRAKASKKGAMMVQKLCNTSKFPSFHSFAEAKTYLMTHNDCGRLKDKQAQAMAIYLVNKNVPTQADPIVVPKDAKCPICGMFVYKYPKWAAKITSNDAKALYFDGNKDLMKYYFKDGSNIKEILVTDYYNITSLPAKSAWYVIGSNVYGPMGHELISFATKEDAQSFKRDHFATEILSFDEITPKIISDLDR